MIGEAMNIARELLHALREVRDELHAHRLELAAQRDAQKSGSSTQ